MVAIIGTFGPVEGIHALIMTGGVVATFGANEAG